MFIIPARLKDLRHHAPRRARWRRRLRQGQGPHLGHLGIPQRGVQSEGGAVDGGSII